jgi:sugar phosphate isomerase/epimerase
MFEAEARWLRAALDRFAPERLSPLLNLGSSTADFRERVQPWTQQHLFEPLRARGIEIVHVDRRAGPGIDIRADLADPAGLARLRALRPQALLCCNLLEHVTEPERIARDCLGILPELGLAFVTVPYSYPYHRDPIDTMYRPSPPELAALFDDARLLDAAVVGAGMSYRDEVRRRPWILLRHAARFPAPFVSWEKWKRSMAKLYWLAAEYRITCAVFEKIGPGPSDLGAFGNARRLRSGRDNPG